MNSFSAKNKEFLELKGVEETLKKWNEAQGEAQAAGAIGQGRGMHSSVSNFKSMEKILLAFQCLTDHENLILRPMMYIMGSIYLL
jgi:hypothetical protein